MNKVIKMLIIASASILFVGSINLLIVHGDTRNLATGQDNNRLNMIQNIQSTGNPVSTNSDFQLIQRMGVLFWKSMSGQTRISLSQQKSMRLVNMHLICRR